MRERTCDQPHAPIAEAHEHAHGDGAHAHVHSHASLASAEHRPRQRRALLVCIALTFATMVVEIAGGIWTGSLMLLSDAAHMLSHALALLVSYVAVRLAGRAASERSHFGFYRAEILGAFLNGIGLLVFTGWIVWEAAHRFLDPVSVPGAEMTAIAVLGLVVNLVTASILFRAGAQDLNTRSALLHMLGDTLSSVAIVVGGGVLWYTGWQWIDPALSLGVALLIVIWGYGLLRQSAAILLELAPQSIDPAEVRAAIVGQVPGVLDVHDLHVWEITSGYVCLTAHVVVEDGLLSATHRVRDDTCALVRERFRVAHATLQIEAPHVHAASPA
jgi:cobalt-zinc-cadmium efflux system protein